MIDVATEYLQKLGAFDDYASVINRLVQVSCFHHDNDDLIVHRCLLASHALAEGYIAAKQSKLSAADYPHGAQPVRYPKDDVKQAVLRSVRGPILGHHQILTCNSAMCFDPGMHPRLAFISYKENLCWLVDWALAHREDRDILPILNSIIGSTLLLLLRTILRVSHMKNRSASKERICLGEFATKSEVSSPSGWPKWTM